MKTLTVLMATALLAGTSLARVLYVHPESTHNNIQACLDSCGAGDTVLVGPGTYDEHDILWPAVQGINLLSERGPDTTIIDGGGGARVMAIAQVVDSASVVSGFTIQNGYVSGGGGGAGIWCEGSSPLITGNIFRDNRCDNPVSVGGGLGCSAANPLIRGNRFEHNHAVWGGGVGVMAASPEVSGNTFFANVADTMGGGLISYASSAPRVLDNLFAYDSAYVGGAVGCMTNSAARFEGNLVQFNNAAAFGGGLYFTVDSYDTIVGDTVMENNCGGNAGGIGVAFGSCPVLTHCFIGANFCSDGGGIRASGAGTDPDIDSCVIVGNYADGVKAVNGAMPSVNWCDIHDNVGNGVSNAGPDSIDARDNWWGHASGPFHPTLNPTGLGDTVSDYVVFVPFIGIAEGPEPGVPERNIFASIVRGNLVLPASGFGDRSPAVLLDITGRKVADLAPGPNDVRHVSPGVYFVRSVGRGGAAKVLLVD